MRIIRLLLPYRKGKKLRLPGLMRQEIEDVSSETHISEDHSRWGDIDHQTLRWPCSALLASFCATATGIVALVWLAITLTLIARLRPHRTTNGLQSVARAWRRPLDSTGLLSPWPQDFSRDIIPKPCHSHNDYWRRVPLFDALAAGCTSVEADIWLPDRQSTSTELRVGHSLFSLTADRTLSSLYIEPLAAIMSNVERSLTQKAGIFETNSSQTVTLLLDFKSDGAELWPYVDAHLEPLRKGGWLRHWDGISKQIVPGPLTIVATGNAPFDFIVANNTYRDIFYDAPLDNLDSYKFDSSNSFFASAALGRAIGLPLLGHFRKHSMDKLTSQISRAEARGLLSRYWAIPPWPISARDRVWNTLVTNRIGMLNVDDIGSATRWNWNWCVVAGVTLCGW